jgi:hypothetical protein
VCGTVTYCHTLVRPGYGPFCMGETTLPISQRLASWTRDHKLWDHVNDHMAESRWPRVCPHPLCDTQIKDAAALQFHLVDDHGFSRSRPPDAVNPTALPSPAEKTSWHKEAEGHRLGRKRKSAGDQGVVEWMPESFPPLPASSGEPLPCYSPKQPRQISPTICSQLLSTSAGVPGDQGVPDEQPSHDVLNSIPLFSAYPPIKESGDPCSHLGRELFPFYGTNPDHTDASLKPEDTDDHRSGDADVLFNQYLRSPSPSPPLSPDGAASQISGTTLADIGRTQSHSGEPDAGGSESPIEEDTTETRATPDQEDTGHVQSGLYIRLRVSQPRITLRLRL